METKVVAKRDGVVTTKQVPKQLPRKKKAKRKTKKTKKMDVVSGVPLDVVENED